MASVDLDAPEHALCSDIMKDMQSHATAQRHAINRLQNEIKKLRFENEWLQSFLDFCVKDNCEDPACACCESVLMQADCTKVKMAAGPSESDSK
jgi:hypothetical protein